MRVCNRIAQGRAQNAECAKSDSDMSGVIRGVGWRPCTDADANTGDGLTPVQVLVPILILMRILNGNTTINNADTNTSSNTSTDPKT